MSAWLAAREWILEAEGGYVHDPDDVGGESKYGISHHAYPALNIAALTEAEAAEIYRRDYWETCQCDELPGPLALAVFDGAVNQGRTASVRMLQLAIESNGGARLTADGLAGPRTVAAAREAYGPELLPSYLSFRAARYAERVREAPSQIKFLRGWMRRLFRLQAVCLRLA